MNRCRVNRIRQIVQLRQIMKRWHALAVSRKVSSTVNGCTLSCGFDLSYDSDEEYCCLSPSSAPPDVPKGYLAVCVGTEKDTRRFVIPTNYLSRPAFRRLLDKAEEEFGFDHQGVLTIPCETLVFENILQNEQDKQAINIISCNEPDVHIPSTPLRETSFA